MFHKKKGNSKIEVTSNIVQFDDMGYPLMLCIMSNGSQQWIDVDTRWANSEIGKGNLHVLKWNKGGIANESIQGKENPLL